MESHDSGSPLGKFEQVAARMLGDHLSALHPGSRAEVAVHCGFTPEGGLTVTGSLHCRCDARTARLMRATLDDLLVRVADLAT